jgi:putative transposase
MITTAKSICRGDRFPAEVIEHAVWLSFRFPLSLRMVEDLLAARWPIVSHETVRSWAEEFGRIYANTIRRRPPQLGDKWRLDEVVISINGNKHWLLRAVDADDFVLDALVQGRRDWRGSSGHDFRASPAQGTSTTGRRIRICQRGGARKS